MFDVNYQVVKHYCKPNKHPTDLLHERGRIKRLKGDGSFASDECVAYLKQVDIVVTNPPFSKFRQFIKLLVAHQKYFLIIGNQNAITYKEVFPLIKQGNVWLGKPFKSNVAYFESPYGYLPSPAKKVQRSKKIKKSNSSPVARQSPAPTAGSHSNSSSPALGKGQTPATGEGSPSLSGAHRSRLRGSTRIPRETNEDQQATRQGVRYARVSGVMWFTNLDYQQQPKPIPLTKHYIPEEYPKYDNYNAIKVHRTADIPMDYPELMTVPITFLTKWSPEQFELVGEANHGSDCKWDLFRPKLNGKEEFKRLVIRNRHPKIN